MFNQFKNHPHYYSFFNSIHTDSNSVAITSINDQFFIKQNEEFSLTADFLVHLMVTFPYASDVHLRFNVNDIEVRIRIMGRMYNIGKITSHSSHYKKIKLNNMIFSMNDLYHYLIPCINKQQGAQGDFILHRESLGTRVRCSYSGNDLIMRILNINNSFRKILFITDTSLMYRIPFIVDEENINLDFYDKDSMPSYIKSKINLFEITINQITKKFNVNDNKFIKVSNYGFLHLTSNGSDQADVMIETTLSLVDKSIAFDVFNYIYENFNQFTDPVFTLFLRSLFSIHINKNDISDILTASDFLYYWNITEMIAL